MIESKLRGFEGICLKNGWVDRTTNKEVATLTGNDCIIAEIKQSRSGWLAHVKRMNGDRHPNIDLTSAGETNPVNTNEYTVKSYLWVGTGSQVCLSLN